MYKWLKYLMMVSSFLINLMIQANNAYSTTGFIEIHNTIKKQKNRIGLTIIKCYNKLFFYEIEYHINKKIFDDFILTQKEPEEKSEKKKYLDKVIDLKRAYIKPKIKAARMEKIIKELNDPSGHSYTQIRNLDYHLHRKLMMAFSALVFGLLGACLGIYSKRTGKSLGLGISVVVIVSFILLIILGNIFMKKQILSPILSSWYTLVIFFIITIILFYRRMIHS